MELLKAILYTAQVRPYVILFLATFLFLSLRNRGVVRTLLFLILGYGIAFLSEYASIRTGFPYGLYHYIYPAMAGELIVGGVPGGVPIWDSLSYTFLAYTSFELTQFLRLKWPSFMAPLLMVAMDIVIDPVAARGDEWFLGKIYYYPEGGNYFGVPYSNFAGWFLVACAIHNSYFFIEKKLKPRMEPTHRQIFLAGPLFYYGILAFNWGITLWIGEWKLGLAGLVLHLPIFSALYRRRSWNS